MCLPLSGFNFRFVGLTTGPCALPPATDCSDKPCKPIAPWLALVSLPWAVRPPASPLVPATVPFTAPLVVPATVPAALPTVPVAVEVTPPRRPPPLERRAPPPVGPGALMLLLSSPAAGSVALTGR